MIDFSKLSSVSDFPPLSDAEAKEADEAYQQWCKELQDALASGDKDRIDEVYEMGK